MTDAGDGLRAAHELRFPALATALLSLLLTACGAERAADTPVERGADDSRAGRQADIERAEAAAGELGERLKARLMATIGESGPVAAIEVCATEAPAIAAEVSAAHGLSVSRSSLRVRNPANAPDARERAVLELWQTKIEDGTPPAALPTFVSNAGEFLWMKPIVARGPCLVCHGRAIPGELADAIALRYPQDRATGFAEGDLRGAFVVRR